MCVFFSMAERERERENHQQRSLKPNSQCLLFVCFLLLFFNHLTVCIPRDPLCLTDANGIDLSTDDIDFMSIHRTCLMKIRSFFCQIQMLKMKSEEKIKNTIDFLFFHQFLLVVRDELLTRRISSFSRLNSNHLFDFLRESEWVFQHRSVLISIEPRRCVKVDVFFSHRQIRLIIF